MDSHSGFMSLHQNPSPEPETQGEFSCCAWPGCRLPGEHRAPLSKENLRDYQLFCLEHVRIYNKAWNYYEGMSDAQVEAAVRSDTVWNRPTWPMGSKNEPPEEPVGSGYKFENVSDAFGFFDTERSRSHPAQEQPSAKERKAVLILGLDYPVTEEKLKSRYKALVKRHHPDANGGDKKAEERFKKINEAYETLMDVLNT